MHVSIIQITLILLYLAFMAYDSMNTQIFIIGSLPVLGGWVTGLILGNPTLGLAIGATLQLMSLGVAAFGGASVPDYYLGAVVGSAVAIMAGKDASYGLVVGLPVSLLAIQLDVLVRTGTTFFLHQGKKYADKLEMKKSYGWIISGYSLWILKYVLPMFLIFIIGVDSIQALLDKIPVWFIGSFRVAGGLLPVVGIGILLKYMNSKNYFAYILIGFALVSYLKIPMLGVAIFGLAMGIISFKSQSQAKPVIAENMGGMDDEDEL